MTYSSIDWPLWLATMVPLIFSAGPGNIMVAASGARSGVRQSMSFIYGLDGTYFLLAVATGLGLGQLLQQTPLLSHAIKVVGITYIFYLAYRFYVALPPDGQQSVRAFKFGDGVVVQITNTKGLLMLIVMFSEFFSPSANIIMDVILMSTVLVMLNFSAHLMWAGFGTGIRRMMLRNPALWKAQNHTFSMMMVMVGIWLTVR